jgi:hypothetical protein
MLEIAVGHHQLAYQQSIYWWLLVAVVVDLDMQAAAVLAD